MIEWRPFRYGLILIVLTAVSGFVGFIIVYHYATFERPVQHYAIVIDAGSTQTRSNLFTIDLDVPMLRNWMDLNENSSNNSTSQEAPLGKLFRVKQVDSCVNGGPLADIQSVSEARELVRKCLEKFSSDIKQLDLKGNSLISPNVENNSVAELSSDDMVGQKLAENNHRINSLTHIYLGATAGMRALSELNETRANEKINWIDKAINESNSILADGPFINKGFVGIITGSDEAAFGWSSVNFICDQLKAEHSLEETPQVLGASQASHLDSYSLDGDSLVTTTSSESSSTKHESNINSIGILELGGASAQMAYEMDYADSSFSSNQYLDIRDLELFNGKHKLAMRSDLCLGMSQAVLRTNFILLIDFYTTSSPLTIGNDSQKIELVNPCLQNHAQLRMSSREIKIFLSGACLAPANSTNNNELKEFLNAKEMILFAGSGDNKQCETLLSNLLEPHLCKQYFSICPAKKNHRPVPDKMPFVTISGYNHALQVLNLTKAPMRLGAPEVEQTIASKLGGYSVNYTNYVEATRQFCLEDVRDFSSKYPQINHAYDNVICLQLVYIRKLLTEFYLFDPATSKWNQIKFLIFPVAPTVNAEGEETGSELSSQKKSDIGWTLGLLLNATSLFYSGDKLPSESIFYHHASSVLFVMRATIFLMFACILMAISLIVMAMLTARHHQRKAYISHPLESDAQCERVEVRDRE